MTVKVRGLDETKRMMNVLAPNEARNLLRSTVHGMAGEARDVARSVMPEDTGEMYAATKIQRRRVRRNSIRSDVMVESDAFYWRFLEYGDGPDGIEHGMFLHATEYLRKNYVRILREQFGQKLIARLSRLAKSV